MKSSLKERPVWFKFVVLGALWIYAQLMFGLLVLASSSNGAGSGLPAWADTPNGIRWIQLLYSVVAMLLPAVIFAQIFEPRPLEFVGLNRPSKTSFLLAAAVLIVLAFPITELITNWNAGLHFGGALSGLDKTLRSEEADQNKVRDIMLSMPRASDLALNLVAIAAGAAFCEEVFFRGVLQKLLIRACRGPVAGILVGAVLFSAMHMEFSGFFPRLLLGIILGCLYWFSGSVWPGILAHFIFNGVQVVYEFVQNNHLSANHFFDPSYTFPVAAEVISGVAVPLGILVLWRMYRKGSQS